MAGAEVGPERHILLAVFALLLGCLVQVVVLTYLSVTGSPYVATLRIRYEFLVTVPEPSAALSIPIGAAWLAGLAAMKGGA